MQVESVFITGANRGIGLEFVRQLVALPNPPKYVFATYRNPDSLKALQEIKKNAKKSQVILIRLDINNPELITAAKKVVEETVGEKGLTLLINNAGLLKLDTFPEVIGEDLLIHFRNNAIGPVSVTQAMLPLLQKSASHHGPGFSVNKAAVLNISSMGGSITVTAQTPRELNMAFSYKISKTALNMAMTIVAASLKSEGILVINMCPGWVKTDMGSFSLSEEQMEKIRARNFHQITPEESISDMLKTLTKLTEEHQGAYLDRNGVTIPF